jgi:hypothetical protein
MPSEASDALDVALRVAAVLEALGVDYFVGGSVASSLHAKRRSVSAVEQGRGTGTSRCSSAASMRATRVTDRGHLSARAVTIGNVVAADGVVRGRALALGV